MRIRILGLCRGEAKTFVEVRVSSISEEATLRLSATTSSGMEIPSKLIQLPQIKKTERHCLIVLPLSRTNIRLTFESILDGNTVESEKAYTLDAMYTKVRSRLTHKFKSPYGKKCEALDTLNPFEGRVISFIECVARPDFQILKGTLKIDEGQADDIRISVLDYELNDTNAKVIFTNTKELVGDEGKAVLLADFSIIIPCDFTVQTICVSSKSSHFEPFFSGIERALHFALFRQFADKVEIVAEDPGYEEWFMNHRATPADLALQRSIPTEDGPLFSIVVPLYKTPLDFLREMIDSVLCQSYTKFQLILVNASPEDEGLTEAIAAYATNDSRITIVDAPENLGISANTTLGTDAAEGDFICFFDHDDLLEPNTLFEYAQAVRNLPNVDLIYCDEDKLDAEGRHIEARFKPDFNLDMLRTNNYICHFLCLRKTLHDSLSPAESLYDGAQDFNMILKAIEKARYVHHVSEMLYHWRISPNSTAGSGGAKPYADKAGMLAVQHHLDRLNIPATVEPVGGDTIFVYKVRYHLADEPLVSIIIPNKDMTETLDTCIRSLFEVATYKNIEVIVVENNSTLPETFDYYDKLQEAYDNVRVVSRTGDFNFSAIVNYGCSQAKGSYYLLLNNDTEVLTPDFIQNMLGFCQRENTAVVGCLLCYKDLTIQHAGLSIGGEGVSMLNRGFPIGTTGYMGTATIGQDISAVTAACLLTTKEDFEAVDGFDETLTVAFNDADYCLKQRERGKLVVFTPDARLYHYESFTREHDDSRGTDGRQVQFIKELATFRKKWTRYYLEGDPYVNKHLDSGSFYYQLPHNIHKKLDHLDKDPEFTPKAPLQPNQPDCTVRRIIPNEGGTCTVVGSALFPSSDCVPSLSLCNNTGDASLQVSILSRRIIKPKNEFEPTKMEVCFSALVPSDTRDLTLVAEDADGKCIPRELGIGAEARKELPEYLTHQDISSAHDSRYTEINNYSQMRHLWKPLYDLSHLDADRVFSIIVPLFETPLHFLSEMIETVVSQTYTSWELVLVNASPKNRELAEAVEDYAKNDARIKVVTLDDNRGIAGNTLAGVSAATGDFVGFLDHDDALDPDTLSKYAQEIQGFPETDLLYCDEDHFVEMDRYFGPDFKPDFNYEFLRTHNYITHFLVMRRGLIDFAKAYASEYDGAQDYNATLMAVENARRIAHIPLPLYHWRMHENSSNTNPEGKEYAQQAGLLALQHHLDRCGEKATAQNNPRLPFQYRVAYQPPAEATVSVVVSARGERGFTKECLEGINLLSSSSNVQIILSIPERNASGIENAIEDAIDDSAPTKEFLRAISESDNINALRNAGAAQATGNYLLFLNGDVSLGDPEDLELLLGLAARESSGAASAVVANPNGTIFDSGTAIHKRTGLVRLNQDVDLSTPGYSCRAICTQNLSVVPARCMMVRASLFKEMKGIDETLESPYGEADFCLRLTQAGKRNIIDPNISANRSVDAESFLVEDDEYSVFTCEERFRYKWAKLLAAGDPYYSQHFDGKSSNFHLHL